MPDRRPIKKADERFHIGNFVNWLNSTYHCNYNVIAEPEPPEAVIQSKTRTSWIEISTAFLDQTHARDTMSRATPGEKATGGSRRVIAGPDDLAARNLISVVKNKLEKKSYASVAKTYGPGYLVIPIRNPLFDNHTLECIKREWAEASINDLGYFRSVRLTFEPVVNGFVQPNWAFYRLPAKRT